MGTLPLSFEQDSPPSLTSLISIESMAGPFPDIKSKHSLVAKHVTEEKWGKLGGIVTKTSGFTLAKAIACAVEFDNQHCGIYADDEDSYIDFADVFDPLICEYHGLPADFSHVSDMDVDKIKGTLPMMSQYTLSEFVLDDPSKDSVCPLESPSNNVLTWKSSWLELLQSSLVILLATTIH